MPFVSRRAQLKLSESEVEALTALAQSRSEPTGRVQRASILLRYRAGTTVSEIARTMGTNRPRVERCVSKALELGVRQALADLLGRGRRPKLNREGAGLGGCFGLPKTKGPGLCSGTLDDTAAGQACPPAL